MITIPWLILERTDSPAFAGLVAAISALPGILVSPIGGWMVDHIGRRAVSIGADILSAFSVATFPIVAATFGLSNLSILLIAVLGAVFDPADIQREKHFLQMLQRLLIQISTISMEYMTESWQLHGYLVLPLVQL